jgi:disulfide bond formation protein DsbB
MMTIPGRRVLNLAGFLACAGMMGFALYAQHVLLLDPCPLCVLQRVAVIGLGVVFLLAALHNPQGWGRRVYAVLVLLFAGDGAAVAGWHWHLQNLPASEVPACGPGLNYMLENFPVGLEFPGPVDAGVGVRRCYLSGPRRNLEQPETYAVGAASAANQQ